MSELLWINDLRTYFFSGKNTIRAVDGVSFRISEGTALGLVGESGCGKTTVAMSILNLIPYLFRAEGSQSTSLASRGEAVGNAESDDRERAKRHIDEVRFLRLKHVASGGEIVGGEIWYKGKDLLGMSQEEVRQIRGKEIGMIFQNPIPALNPIEMIGMQVGEAVEAHDQTRRDELRRLVFDYLGRVELKDAKKRYMHNPHMFSGGEGQRIMIAMALINGPSLLIADEPTKSLDMLVQKQVLTLLQKVKKEFKLSTLLITHDLAIVAELSDFVAVMCAGRILEYGDSVSVYKKAKHPYTQGLLASVQRIDRKRKSVSMRAEPLNPLVDISGCRFHSRCPYAIDACTREEPPLTEVAHGHSVACIRISEIPEWQD